MIHAKLSPHTRLRVAYKLFMLHVDGKTETVKGPAVIKNPGNKTLDVSVFPL